MQFSRNTYRHRIQLPVEQIYTAVWQRATDGNIFRDDVSGRVGRLESGHANAGLGRAIGVDPTNSAADCIRPSGAGLRRSSLTANNDQADTRRDWLFQFTQVVDPLMPVSRGQIQNCNTLPFDPGQKLRHCQGHFRRPQYHRSTALPGAEQFFDGDVKANRTELKHSIARPDSVH